MTSSFFFPPYKSTWIWKVQLTCAFSCPWYLSWFKLNLTLTLISMNCWKPYGNIEKKRILLIAIGSVQRGEAQVNYWTDVLLWYNAFLTILFYSLSGDDPQKILAKFDYNLNIKHINIKKIILYFFGYLLETMYRNKENNMKLPSILVKFWLLKIFKSTWL